MTSYSPAEQYMWENDRLPNSERPSDSEINNRYGKRELRIVTETNREQLPNFVAALKRPGWMRLQPFYQRRRRWDDQRKSKLIESFIMNIPVPPCFLYESEFARYEVMDGQQRISAIEDFYEGRFALKGLEQWPELNGRKYERLPSAIRQGLDRRSLSYIVLLKESASSSDEEILLRQQVFERLNTGGVELENQEIRHCIYHNEFDDLLIRLSRHPIMRTAWGLPLYDPEEEQNIPERLLSDAHFSKMKDVEFILRFFALRHVEHYRGGMQQFLDRYMIRSRRFGRSDIDFLKNLFKETLELASTIYEENLFCPWNAKKNSWATTPQVAYGDSILVGLSKHLHEKQRILSKKSEIVSASRDLVIAQKSGTFTGQRNTKDAIKDRFTAYEEMLSACLA